MPLGTKLMDFKNLLLSLYFQLRVEVHFTWHYETISTVAWCEQAFTRTVFMATVAHIPADTVSEL